MNTAEETASPRILCKSYSREQLMKLNHLNLTVPNVLAQALVDLTGGFSSRDLNPTNRLTGST
jgi:hypothetical protein